MPCKFAYLCPDSIFAGLKTIETPREEQLEKQDEVSMQRMSDKPVDRPPSYSASSLMAKMLHTSGTRNALRTEYKSHAYDS